MKVRKINLFFLCIVIGLILTCTLGVREIGRDLYKYYKKIPQRTAVENINEFFHTVDNTLNKNFVLQKQCVDVYGLIQRMKGSRIVDDADPTKTVVKGDDGKLYFAGNATGSEDNTFETVGKTAEKIKDFADYCASRNSNFLYVIAPSKYSAEVGLPGNVSVNDDSSYAEFFAGRLKEKGVNCINLMSEVHKDYEHYSDAFFVTDHHWNIKAAFWAYQKICGNLNATYNEGIEKQYYDMEQYSVITYPNCFLGSMGARVGRYYAGMDDMDLIAPKYETDFRVRYFTKTLGQTVERNGSYDEAIIAGEPHYNMYITSDNALIQVDNLIVDNGHKVLLIKDSFGVPVSAWLSCWADELSVMDLRYEQKQSVCDYIEENDIDTVIVLYNAGMLSSESIYNFDGICKGW